MNKYKLYKNFFITLLLITILITLYFFYTKIYNEKIAVKNAYMKKNHIYIKLNNDGKCKIKNKWVKSNNKICKFNYIDKINIIYIKNIYGKTFKYKIDKDFSIIKDFIVDESKLYLPINSTSKISYKIDAVGEIKDKVIFESENNEIATVENDIIKGLKDGNTNIFVKLRNLKKTINVTVTSLITERPDEYNQDREYLSCNQYTKEQNDLLDEILKYRINKVGYKTRAGVVEAARFIALEFPYRIAYFSENGRLHTYGVTSKVDGEGRYYHEGLFLNESRYQKLSPIMHGPGTWGCKIFSNPSNGYRANGFDCSGFISWIILNGGFDSEDVGAGVSSYKDLTDLGNKINLNESIANNKLRAGDLLSGQASDGGHIALIAGMKDGYYYVAESLWVGTGYFGSLIRKYDSNDLKQHFYWHVDLNDYYKEDGKYTEYWK